MRTVNVLNKNRKTEIIAFVIDTNFQFSIRVNVKTKVNIIYSEDFLASTQAFI